MVLNRYNDTRGSEPMPRKKAETTYRKNRFTEGEIMAHEGYNAKTVAVNLEIMSMPSVDWKDPEGVKERIRAYFMLCAQYDKKPGIAALAAALGTTRVNIKRVAQGKELPGFLFRNIPEATLDLIKQAYLMTELQWEDDMQSGNIHPTAGIFLGINNHDYHDVKQFTLTPIQDDPMGDAIPIEELKQKYLDSIPEEDGN